MNSDLKSEIHNLGHLMVRAGFDHSLTTPPGWHPKEETLHVQDTLAKGTPTDREVAIAFGKVYALADRLEKALAASTMVNAEKDKIISKLIEGPPQ
jgi:hypothetical protein